MDSFPLNFFSKKKKKNTKEIKCLNIRKDIKSFALIEKNQKRIKKINFYIKNLLHFKKNVFSANFPCSFFFKKIFKQKSYVLLQSFYGLELFFLEKNFNFELLIFHLKMEMKNVFFKKKSTRKLIVFIQNFDLLTYQKQKKIKRFFETSLNNLKIFIIISDKFKVTDIIRNSSQVIKLKKFHEFRKVRSSDLLATFFEIKNLLISPKTKSIGQRKCKNPQRKIKNLKMWSFLSQKNTKNGMIFTVYEKLFFFIFGLFDFFLEFKPSFFQPLIELGGSKDFLTFSLKGISKWAKKRKYNRLEKWKKDNYLVLFRTLIFFAEKSKKTI